MGAFYAIARGKNEPTALVAGFLSDADRSVGVHEPLRPGATRHRWRLGGGGCRSGDRRCRGRRPRCRARGGHRRRDRSFRRGCYDAAAAGLLRIWIPSSSLLRVAPAPSPLPLLPPYSQELGEPNPELDPLVELAWDGDRVER